MKLGKETCSVQSWILSGCKNLPIVGAGATELMWSDRKAYEVIDVSSDMKKVVIQRYHPKRIDNNGVGDYQEYEYKELTNYKLELHFKWDAYRFLANKKWLKINIIFGLKQEYYDFSF